MARWAARARGVARLGFVGLAVALLVWPATAQQPSPKIGDERAIPYHWQDGQEFRTPLADIVSYGEKLFTANWTEDDGAGRPLTKGTGQPLTDRSQPLRGNRAFNRLSGPDANSCLGCHNGSTDVVGGSGDFVTNTFVVADRFDFVTFDRTDKMATRGSLDEAGRPATLQTIGNSRSTPDLFGAGYLEMLARQITQDLQHTRDQIQPGQSRRLLSKGISFGVLSRRADGAWDARRVEGLARPSLQSAGPAQPPSLVVRPWRQSGSAVSLREITNKEYNSHLGIQTTEWFGIGTDPDGDGVRNEMTRADVTAAAVFQATLAVPGRVIPNDPQAERAILAGEHLFEQIGCTTCHVPALPLDRRAWIYAEPGPYNPAGTLHRGTVKSLEVDLTDPSLPQPRLTPSVDHPAVLQVPAYTDFKLHDITDPSDPTAQEPLDINQPAGSAQFLAGNRKFLTRRLWGVGSSVTHFHHGLFTTIRQAVEAHAGEALEQRRAFDCLGTLEQQALIKFLESMRLLPPGTKARVVDEDYQPKRGRLSK